MRDGQQLGPRETPWQRPCPRPGQPVRYADVPSLPGLVAIQPGIRAPVRRPLRHHPARVAVAGLRGGGRHHDLGRAGGGGQAGPGPHVAHARHAVRRAGCAGCTTAPTGAWSGSRPPSAGRNATALLPEVARLNDMLVQDLERDRGRAVARLPGAHRATRPAHGRGQHRVGQGQPARRRHPPGEVEAHPASFNRVSTNICYARRLPSAQPRHGRPRPPRPRSRPGAPTDIPCPASSAHPSSVVSKA